MLSFLSVFLHISINLCGGTYTRSERICIEIIMSNPIKNFDMFSLHNAVCDIAWCGVWTCGSSAVSYHMRSYPICLKCLWCTKKNQSRFHSIQCVESFPDWDLFLDLRSLIFFLIINYNKLIFISFFFFLKYFFFQFSFLHCEHPKTNE